MDLIYGAGNLNRQVTDVEHLLSWYAEDIGLRYLDYQPITPRDRLVPEDLAVTILVNSRVGWRAFASVQDNGPSVDLSILPDKPLEETTGAERQALADLLATIASWPGLAASTVTKVLHKKRPALIPILDNQAIFGACMNDRWPNQRLRWDSVRDVATIKRALNWIAADLTWPENAQAWSRLQASQPDRSPIEIFDMVWWAHFRKLEPVKPASVI